MLNVKYNVFNFTRWFFLFVLQQFGCLLLCMSSAMRTTCLQDAVLNMNTRGSVGIHARQQQQQWQGFEES